MESMLSKKTVQIFLAHELSHKLSIVERVPGLLKLYWSCRLRLLVKEKTELIVCKGIEG